MSLRITGRTTLSESEVVVAMFLVVNGFRPLCAIAFTISTR